MAHTKGGRAADASFETCLRANNETVKAVKALAKSHGVSSMNAMMVLLLEEYASAWRSRGNVMPAALATLGYETCLRIPRQLAGKLKRIAVKKHASLNDVLNHAFSTALETPPDTSELAASKRKKMVHLPEDGMPLFSTRHPDEPTIARLEMGVLKLAAAHAATVDIASAFYDCRFLKSLLVLPRRRNGHVRILLNGLGGSRLSKQCDELMSLVDSLKKSWTRVEIRLAFEPGIFHSKVYAFGKLNGSTEIFFGSANATNAALNLNEEVLIRLPHDGSQIPAYFEEIWSQGKPVEGIEEPKAHSLIAFFRSGVLYFKPSVSLQKSYNPFSVILRLLSDDEKQLLAPQTATIPYAEENGITGFSIERALEVQAERDAVETERTVARSSPYVVETCLGYWVPCALQDALDEKLDSAGAGKRQRLEDLRRHFDRCGKSKLMHRYGEYLSVVKDRFRDAHLDPQKVMSNAGRHDTHFTGFETDGFASFLDRFRTRLDDEAFLQRYCHALVSGPMPEIWDDIVVFSEFKDSFFEYVLFVRTQKTGRKVPDHICTRAGFPRPKPPPDSTHELIGALSEYLKKRGWDSHDWLVKADEE